MTSDNGTDEYSIEKFGSVYQANLNQGVPIAIDLDFDGGQPNHFGVEAASRSPLTTGEFVGETSQGGSCNVDVITLTPHCNGTHTETVGHIVNDSVFVSQYAKQALYLAELVTVEAVAETSAILIFRS